MGICSSLIKMVLQKMSVPGGMMMSDPGGMMMCYPGVKISLKSFD